MANYTGDKKSGGIIVSLNLVAIIALLAALSVISSPVTAHAGHSHDSVVVRVSDYNPLTNEYTISCTIPDATLGSRIDPRRFYAIDPIPAGLNKSYYSNQSTFTWKLNPENFTELVHTNAMYHMYCEVQNFSASPGQQNLVSEFHVDLRTTHNQNDPNIYVIESEGPRATLKCDPPHGIRDYSISWKLRSREGIISFPELSNKRIVNITSPRASAGWDVVCDVADKRTGKFYHWDMPIEFFEEGPAYIPTIEGCLPNQPCYQASPDGIVPNGSLIISVSFNNSPAQADVYLNEAFRGMTTPNGALSLNNIVPGIYNLVIKKNGLEEISTLVPIAAGKQLSRSYVLETIKAGESCYSSVAAIPANCSSGTITQDTVSGSCRTIICSNTGSSMKILACNKPDGSSPQYFEIYKQSQAGNLVSQICIGSTCIKDSGFARSLDFPICTENTTMQVTNGTLRVFSSPNQADVFLNNIFKGNTGFIGEFTQSISPGTYSIRVSKPDYNNFTAQATITKGQVTEINAVLSLSNPQNNTQPSENSTNTTNPDQATICYDKVQSIPANCTATITQDTQSGTCRTLVCSSGSSSIKVLACDKPDSGEKQYFEMYRQATTGAPPKLCIGKTCIQNDGYKRSEDYPICFNQTQTDTSSNIASIIFSLLSTDALMIAKCEAFNPTLDENATSWRWDFGEGIVINRDGFRQINDEIYGGVYPNDDILHTFTSSGPQTVKCEARFADNSSATSSKVFNSQVQNEVIVHFKEDNSTFTLLADPINAHTGDISTAVNLWGYPFKDNSGNVNKGSISSRAVPPNQTYNKPDVPGTWDMEWEVQSNYVSPAQLAIGYNGESALNFFGYDPFNITGYKQVGNSHIPIYQGISYLPFSIPYGYQAIGGIHAATTYRFNITVPNQSSTNTTQCFSKVNDIPATCTSTVTQDTKAGCRTIVCGTSINSIKVLACNKPDSSTKTHFEMYRQAFSGSPPKVCIGNTCIQNDGFKKSENYPICT